MYFCWLLGSFHLRFLQPILLFFKCEANLNLLVGIVDEFSDIVRFGVGYYVADFCLHMELCGGENKCRFRQTVYLIPGGTYETCIQIVPARLISTLNSSGSMLTLTRRPPVIKEMYHISLQSSGTLNHNHERFLQKRLLSDYEFEKVF